jgi:hypothetical protein
VTAPAAALRALKLVTQRTGSAHQYAISAATSVLSCEEEPAIEEEAVFEEGLFFEEEGLLLEEELMGMHLKVRINETDPAPFRRTSLE